MSGLEKQKPDWWCCDAEYGSHSDECVKRSISEAIATERSRIRARLAEHRIAWIDLGPVGWEAGCVCSALFETGRTDAEKLSWWQAYLDHALGAEEGK